MLIADPSRDGRTVTVTGGQLDTLTSSSLLIRDGSGGSAFYCYGSFSDYMSTATKIDSLRNEHRSPIAIVTGKYNSKGYASGPELQSCVITDLKK